MKTILPGSHYAKVQDYLSSCGTPRFFSTREYTLREQGGKKYLLLGLIKLPNIGSEEEAYDTASEFCKSLQLQIGSEFLAVFEEPVNSIFELYMEL